MAHPELWCGSLFAEPLLDRLGKLGRGASMSRALDLLLEKIGGEKCQASTYSSTPLMSQLEFQLSFARGTRGTPQA